MVFFLWVWSDKLEEYHDLFHGNITDSNLAPENGWSEDDSFPFWCKPVIFSRAFVVSFREGS